MHPERRSRRYVCESGSPPSPPSADLGKCFNWLCALNLFGYNAGRPLRRFSKRRMKQVPFALVFAAVLLSPATRAQEVADTVLRPTNHPRLPVEASQLWLAPDAALVARLSAGAMNEFTTAVKLEVDGNFVKALPMLEQAPMQQSALGHYADYYVGLAQLRLGRPADARRTFQNLAAKSPTGYLVEAAALREAECDEAMGDQASAMDVYDRLAQTKTTAPDEVLMHLARAAKAAGRPDKAAEAFARIVYEFPLGDLA